jgi:ATP-binding cassette subfamily B protein RaxB
MRVESGPMERLRRLLCAIKTSPVVVEAADRVSDFSRALRPTLARAVEALAAASQAGARTVADTARRAHYFAQALVARRIVAGEGALDASDVSRADRPQSGSEPGPRGLARISEHLNFAFRPRLPVLKQTEAAECGLACLAMISCYFGRLTDVTQIRTRFATSNRGLTLADLMKVAGRIQLSTRAVRLELNDIAKLQTPAILHWNLDHFVVLKRVERKGIRIHDPARGDCLVLWPQVDRAFSGVALEIWPASDFAKGDDRRKIRILDVTGPIKGIYGYFLSLFAIGALLEILSICLPIFSQWAIDNVVVQADSDLLTLLAIAMLSVLLLQLVFSAFRRWFITYTGSTFGLQWRTSVLAHLVRLPMDWFQKRHLGDVTSKFNATMTILSSLNSMFVESIFDGVMSVVTLILMAVYSLKLCLIAVAVMAAYAAFRLLYMLPYRRALEDKIAAGAREETHLIETIRGVRTVKLFSREDDRKAEWLSVAVEETNATVRIEKFKLVWRLANDAMAAIERVAIFWLGMKAVLDHEMTLGAVTAFFAYKDQFYSRVTSLVDNVAEMNTLNTYLHRVADIVLAPVEKAELATDQPRFDVLSGRIECVDLRFRYGEAEPFVLDGVNLLVEEGESLAIVGASGCGKTTLINLMLGLQEPISGKVMIGGVSIASLGTATARSKVAAVMQDDILFAGSIAENIASFDPRLDMGRVIACAQVACVHDDIGRMPMAYNSLVGDMGSALSGGQKQRIQIARALYKRPRILVMDEATSHLDVRTEAQVSQNIAALGVTRIIVAHRPNTIRSADRIVKLLDGRVVTADVLPEIDFRMDRATREAAAY